MRVIASLALVLGLAAPARADVQAADATDAGPDVEGSAHDALAAGCACDVADWTVFEMDVASPETPDPLTELAVAPPRRATSVLFCAGGDDPRCQRDDVGDAPELRFGSSASAFTLPSTHLSFPPLLETEAPVDETQGRAFDAIVGRLDRPPR